MRSFSISLILVCLLFPASPPWPSFTASPLLIDIVSSSTLSRVALSTRDPYTTHHPSPSSILQEPPTATFPLPHTHTIIIMAHESPIDELAHRFSNSVSIGDGRYRYRVSHPNGDRYSTSPFLLLLFAYEFLFYTHAIVAHRIWPQPVCRALCCLGFRTLRLFHRLVSSPRRYPFYSFIDDVC